MPNKVIIPGKVERLNKKKFRVKKDQVSEIDAEIDIAEPGDYDVERLSTGELPKTIGETHIRWFTNFAIKKNGKYINQRYSVTISGLGACNVVICDSTGKVYYYEGKVVKDTIELTDGDPGVGGAP